VVSWLGLARLGLALGAWLAPLGVLLLTPSAAGCGGFAASSRGLCAWAVAIAAKNAVVAIVARETLIRFSSLEGPSTPLADVL
jgi:hypothetical protein